ncbi:GNAT family N-acetyltransferase [Kineosporia sp. J2-2]|uniref:GNAT family N-acetyltransferase n=1 Tax=Kineosporia corallincola TaxID=2835133 RepID=A0ABS5TS18_9ACTN|nr:GNAT family N-acetyltransferase [Kineosporia corallincola]MBT0773588.1 GNAT family N-acetyltransferase [Kineosporia corallincola]
MEVTSLGYRTDLMMRRLGGSQVSDRGSHLVVRTPANPHYWWGNYLLLRERPQVGEWPGWVAEFAREFPQAAHVALGLDNVDGEIEDGAGLAALGFEILVDTVMTATALVPPAGPADHAEIRALRGDDDWAQLVRLRLALHGAGDNPAFAEFAARKAAEYRSGVEAGHGAWFGAFVHGEMRCGAGLFSDGLGVARFQNVETHPDFRRQGLASALVHRLGCWGLDRLEAEKLVMVADPGYHAIRLYRALGFRDVEHQVQAQRPPGAEK